MEKRTLNQLLFLASLLVGILLALPNKTSAASFETVKENVENGTGVIVNPCLNRVMTKEESIDYLQFIEEEQSKEQTQELSEELQEKALRSILPNQELLGQDSLVGPYGSLLTDPVSTITRGASQPTNDYYLRNKEIYRSDYFSGSGWRYSGYNFKFQDYGSNPYFGVRVYSDSFNAITKGFNGIGTSGSWPVYPSALWTYIPNEKKYKLYLSTYNPVYKSWYEVS